jgi:hypothetical protein
MPWIYPQLDRFKHWHIRRKDIVCSHVPPAVAE